MRSKGAALNKSTRIMVKRLREDLLRWICERHATDGPLNRDLLRDEALQISCSLGLTGFKCSNAWLTRFLKKHGFSTTLINTSGPKFGDYRKWVDLMKSLITQYRYKDLFHVDEMGMYNDVGPERISAAAENMYKNKEDVDSRITVLLCCNAAGTEKLPPLICGKYNDRVMRNDCQYFHNEDAWLTEEIFNEWLLRLNDRMSECGRQILLMLHRNGVHVPNGIGLSHVKLMFFPKSFPTNLRPLKRNIFHYVKMIYRRRYMKRICEMSYGWSMMNTIDNVVASWNGVGKDLIVSSFRRTRFRSDQDKLNISCTDWNTLGTGITFKRYVTFDDDLPVSSSCKVCTDAGVERPGCGHDYNLRKASQEEVIQIDDSDDGISIVKDLDATDQYAVHRSNESTDSRGRKYRLPIVANEDQSLKVDEKRPPSLSGTTSGVHDSDSERSYSNLDLDLSPELAETVDVSTGNDVPVMNYVSEMVQDVVGSAMGNVERLDGDKPIPLEASKPSAERKRRQTGYEEDDEEDQCADLEGPESKKQRTESSSWSDIYRQNFVFGQNIQRTLWTTHQTEPLGEDCIIESCNLTEDPSVFTISDNSPGPSPSSKE